MTSVLYGIANFFGELLGLVGMLVFGAGAAWLVISTLRSTEGDKPWQLQAVVAGTFFAMAAFIIMRGNPGDFGAFTLGAGGGILYWSFWKTKKVEAPVVPAAPVTPAPVEAPKTAE